MLGLGSTLPAQSISGGGSSEYSDLIAHAILLNDYKTYGTTSFAYKYKDLLHSIYTDYVLSMNDDKIKKEAFDYIVNRNVDIGKALSCIEEANHSPILEGVSDIDTLLSNIECVEFILNNSVLYDIFFGNSICEGKFNKFLKDRIEDETLFNNETLFNFTKSNGTIKNIILENKNYINIMMNNENYLSYFNSISSKTTTSSVTGVYYLISMATTGVAYTSNSYIDIKAACSGASYVDISGTSTALRSAVSNASSGSYSDTTYTVNKVVKSFSCITASYYYSTPTTNGEKYLNTTATYKPLFA